MSTPRFRRIAQVWNWLPAFRRVAEHESIHKASVDLATSPSALSRTVKLLEKSLDLPLFERHGPRMTLTPEGERLLEATRNAMRSLDDAVAAVETGKRAELWIGTTSPLAATLTALAMAAPAVRACVKPNAVDVGGEDRLEEALGELRRGELDVIVSTTAARSAGIDLRRVGDVSVGVYAANTHPLAARVVAEASLEEHTFVVRTSDDGWPIERPRTIGAISATLEGVLALLRAGDMLACLADRVVDDLGFGALCRLASAGPPRPLYAIWRTPQHGREQPAVPVFVEVLASMTVPSPKPHTCVVVP